MLTHASAPNAAERAPATIELPLTGAPTPGGLLRQLRQTFPGADAALFAREQMDADAAQPPQTIVAFDPFETIRVRGGMAWIRSADGTTGEAACDNPFELVAARLRAHDSLFASSPQAGFPGGAIGYFGYDCIRFIEPAVCRTVGNLSRLNSTATRFDAEILLFAKLAVYDYSRGTVTLIAHDIGDADAADDLDQLENAFAKAPREPETLRDDELAMEVPFDAMRSTLGRDGYLAAVRTLKEHIRAGDIFQAVLSERLETEFRGDPIDLFEVLSALGPSPYRFCILSGGSAYIGSSPEMLLSVTADGRLETHPIAGTRPLDTTTSATKRRQRQLLRSSKERAEHLMLVDLSRNDLGRVARPGSVRVESFMQVRYFSSVMHLVSRVTAQLKEGVTPLAALASCFPAGTLSGAPKIRAVQLISALEPVERGFYGGAVVALSFTGDLDSCIAIRCVEVGNGIATVQAGAGVVADSRPAMELAEVMHKTQTVRKAIAIVAARSAQS